MKTIRSVISAILFLVVLSIAGCSPRVAPVSEYARDPIDPRGLITVNDQHVKDSLKLMLADTNDVRTDFRRIQDWVAQNVEYKTEVGWDWQWPSDTLNKKTGDCKDYSTLLCTLWRTYGIPASDVYVAIGQSKTGKRHAFLIEKYITGKWQVVEPQVGGFIMSELSAVDTSEQFAITFLFNDIEYINQAGSIYEIIKGIAHVPVAKSKVKKVLPKINTFSVDRASVPAGGSVQLIWNVTGATYVGIDQGVGAVSPVGTCVIFPRDTAEYRIVALNDAGSVMASVAVKVFPVAYAERQRMPSFIAFDEQQPFMVGFDGWYMDNNAVEKVNVGQAVMARISLKKGNQGQYILRVWRDIGGGHNEIMAQSSFTYDGVAVNREITFSPVYALGEAGTRGYWLDLLGNGEQVWVMPNEYPPRLTSLQRPVSGPLKIGFIGWYKSVNAITSVQKGQDITTGITMAGGDAGEYILYVKRDIVGLNDESIAETTFNYDGTSALQEIKFDPIYATQEEGTRGYYLDLYKDNKFIWSLSGSYPPRLTVVP
jgi:predicted transglutaminase-like cysteine proteinase